MSQSTIVQMAAVVVVVICVIKMTRSLVTAIMMPVLQRAADIKTFWSSPNSEAMRATNVYLGGGDRSWLWHTPPDRAKFEFVRVSDRGSMSKLRAWCGGVFTFRRSDGDSSRPKLRSTDRVLIWFCGNGYVGEDALPMMSQYVTAYDLDALITWNLPGTSHGRVVETLHDLVQSAAASVEMVEFLGGKASNTLIHGHSLGGNIGLYVQEWFHPEVGVICDRTFRSLSSIAAVHAPSIPYVEYLIRLSGWYMSCEDILRDRDTATDAGGAPKRKFCYVLFHEADEIIPPATQLRSAKKGTELLGGAGVAQIHGASLNAFSNYSDVVRRVRSEFYGLRSAGMHMFS